jgi:hypothetical protein
MNQYMNTVNPQIVTMDVIREGGRGQYNRLTE